MLVSAMYMLSLQSDYDELGLGEQCLTSYDPVFFLLFFHGFLCQEFKEV